MKQLKNIGMILLVPALFAAYEYTRLSGFYNVGAFLIWIFTILMLFMASVMTWGLAHESLKINEVQIPDKPKGMLYVSRLVAICTTIYLVWGNHIATALIDIVNLILSFYFWALFKKIKGMQEASV